ncbi:MAG: HAD family phosphatase [Candidatus Levybacteria bacterium]|nr:HAD family phosphatase [Candidatus Levybacteria bacterium]
MIKAIVTDVDGVIIGNKDGFNFPTPSIKVSQALQSVNKKIPVVLCTAKVSFAIEHIIKDLKLENPHIGDGGALIFDAMQDKIITRHVLDNTVAKNIISFCCAHKLHISAHTVNTLFIDKSHNAHITEKRKRILGRDLEVVEELSSHIDPHEIIKLTVTLQNENEKSIFLKNIEPYMNDIHLIFSHHPITVPWEYAIISAKGISKASASKEVAKSLNISMEEVLGIGDGISDWIFMKECGYVGVVGETSNELIELSKTKGEGNYCNAQSVDQDGMVEILKYFKLL